MSLYDLLMRDQRASEYYESLHPSVKDAVDAMQDEITSPEDLSAIANNEMTRELREYGQIYDDSDSWPD